LHTRVGIELSPVACRLVELEGPPVEPGRAPETRVRSYAVLPPFGPETDSRLAALGRRPAAVVVWGVGSDHRQVVVSNGSYEKMRTEALASVRSAGVDTRDTLADVATASTAIKGADRQPVVLALASADDVSAAMRPLLDARVRIRSVMTPADALLGLARARQAFAVPGGIEAYVALDETVTCVALVRDGSLLGARELAWGYADGAIAPAASAPAEISRRDDLAARLVDELTRFLAIVGGNGSAVAQVSICGGLPELRTMTVPLMERLDVEVEALDSLFGIDVERLPEPADEFRERASALRLAWAAGADWQGPINLMRYRRRRNRRVAVARAAVVAGVAAGLGAGWTIQQSAWWQSTTPQPVARRTPAGTPGVTPTALGATPPPSNATASARPPMLPPAPVGAVAARGTPPAGTNGPIVTPPPPAARVTPPPTTPPPAARVTPPPATPPPAARVTAPPATPPPAARVTPPPATSPPAARVTPPPATPPPAARVTAPPTTPPPAAQVTPPSAPPAATPEPAPSPPVTPPVARSAPPPARRAQETAVPFDAVLGTILYSPDRKLAIINGRIVGTGDVVNGARIVDITPATVLLRDAQGRLRSLTLGSAGRSETAP